MKNMYSKYEHCIYYGLRLMNSNTRVNVDKMKVGHLVYEPAHNKTNMTCMTSEDSDQPGHPHSLISLPCVLYG